MFRFWRSEEQDAVDMALPVVGGKGYQRAILVILATLLGTTAFLKGYLPVDQVLDLAETVWQMISAPDKTWAFESMGLGGLILLFVLQAAQVLISFIPAGPLMVAGAVAFGPWWGLTLSLSGAVVGSVTAFVIGRRLGRPAIVRLVGEKVLNKYAGEMGKGGLWILAAPRLH